MIKFFRQLRQRMIKDNRVSKYLLYALGEIMLVVIGIFLALQLNNWNGDRKESKYERMLLEKIQEDLRLDTIDLRFNLRYHESMRRSESALLDLLMNGSDTTMELDYNEALGSDLILNTHRSAYQNLIQHDIGIVKDDSLKSKLDRHYDFFYPVMERIENDMPAYDLYSRKIPFFAQHFKLAQDMDRPLMHAYSSNGTDNYLVSEPGRRAILPIDLQAMQNDGAFKMVLSECVFQRGIVIDFYTDVLKRTTELDKRIDAYLNKDR